MTIHRRFYALVILRVLLLMATIFAFAFVFGRAEMLVNHIIIASIIIVQVIEMIHFVSRTNRELARLFNAVVHHDFAVTFRDGIHGHSFKELESSLNAMIESYKAVKIEREAQYHLLQRLVNNLNIAIIAVQNSAEISIINPAAEKLIGETGAKSWKILEQLKPSFTQLVEEIGDNGRKLAEWKIDGESKMLSIDVSTNLLLDLPHRLIIIQDINQEIEQKEIEAWHKLIRILTHEIMNSVTPISSLTETTQSMLRNKDGVLRKAPQLTDEVISDIDFSLRTIQKRSEGLLTFVETYRTLSKVPKPVLAPVEIRSLLSSVEQLMREETSRNNIVLDVNIKATSAVVPMDRVLVEQVLINLIGNSIHALAGRPDPHIVLSAYDADGNVIIEVYDNGWGIDDKVIGHIFVPFFSTRQDGSGIGLSLSKQIMSSHGGNITVRSIPRVETRFFLRFKLRA
ncbi:MAG TPA: ATP-binding protein [Ohtaekwangia sp.]|nr:ATP-binding protein [Ohtaekwangia sp.]